MSIRKFKRRLKGELTNLKEFNFVEIQIIVMEYIGEVGEGRAN